MPVAALRGDLQRLVMVPRPMLMTAHRRAPRPLRYRPPPPRVITTEGPLLAGERPRQYRRYRRMRPPRRSTQASGEVGNDCIAARLLTRRQPPTRVRQARGVGRGGAAHFEVDLGACVDECAAGRTVAQSGLPRGAEGYIRARRLDGDGHHLNIACGHSAGYDRHGRRRVVHGDGQHRPVRVIATPRHGNERGWERHSTNEARE